eukprot:jgi/Picsp_1/5077/NSC_02440-R1_hypothetical protein P700755_04347 [Psychroflexus torquis ATCC 700755]
MMCLLLASHAAVMGQEGDDSFYRDDNSVTVMCSEAEIGDTGTLDGIQYTKGVKDELRARVDGGPIQFPLLASTCTSGIADRNGLFNYESYEYDMDESELSIFNEDISGWHTSNVVATCWPTLLH